MTARSLFALWLVVAAMSAARPAGAAGVIDSLLLASDTSSRLRASLYAFVSSAPESATASRGAAWFYAGMSYERAGQADSALLCYGRAVATRGGGEERDAYVDALLLRGKSNDAERALEVLQPRLQAALYRSERDIAATRGRWAWARYVQGHGDSALAGLRLQQRWLLDEMTPRHGDWRYRLGLLELESGSPSKCLQLMAPLAISSRLQDRDVMGILREAAQKAPEGQALPDYIKREILRGDQEDQEILDSLRAKRVIFMARDGFKLSSVLYAKPRSKPSRAAIAILNPGETFDVYDSLATGLVNAGYAVLVLDPRGSGWSVSPACPLPETWRGREEEIQHLVAQDAVVAFGALAGAARVDTTRFLVIGSRRSASIVAEAATLDRRARPLVLLSPDPSPVDRGSMRSRLQAVGAPVYFVVPSTEVETLPIAEALYQALDRRASRISESDLPGGSTFLFRHDRTAMPRLLKWLDESWGAPLPKPGTGAKSRQK